MYKLFSKSGLIVSLHDIWPGNYERADRDLQWLRQLGVRSTGLFVVPCYHGQKPIEEEPAFVDWIQSQLNLGATLFAHGTHHLTQEKRGEKTGRHFFGKWVNNYLQDEAEFTGLKSDGANELLQRSLGHFEKAGLKPIGWVFPTWLGSLPKEFEFPTSYRMIDGRFFIRDLKSQRKQWAPPLTFGIQKESNERFVHGGLFANGFLKTQKWVRLALHPGDLRQSSVRKLVESWLVMRNSVSYDSLFSTSELTEVRHD